MFRSIKALAAHALRIGDQLERLTEAVHGVGTQAPPDADLGRRVANLELELERRHAEAEGLLLRAKGQFDAARAAEERARKHAIRAENAVGGSDEGDELDPEEIQAAYEAAGVFADDGGGSRDEGLQPVHPRLARRAERKAGARAMKFSR
jgi:hypothetical protein